MTDAASLRDALAVVVVVLLVLTVAGTPPARRCRLCGGPLTAHRVASEEWLAFYACDQCADEGREA